MRQSDYAGGYSRIVRNARMGFDGVIRRLERYAAPQASILSGDVRVVIVDGDIQRTLFMTPTTTIDFLKAYFESRHGPSANYTVVEIGDGSREHRLRFEGVPDGLVDMSFRTELPGIGYSSEDPFSQPRIKDSGLIGNPTRAVVRSPSYNTKRKLPNL